jgi:hypothetical protein
VDYPDAVPRIQVEHYPALNSFRQANGSWGLENMHVFIRQADDINVDDIPVIANLSICLLHTLCSAVLRWCLGILFSFYTYR